MAYQEIVDKTKAEFDKALDFFARELTKVRTGQASPALVEDIMVEAYGQKMAVKQLAAISCPERRQILVQPWDSSMLASIERALMQVSFGASPIVDKDSVRIILPTLTQEFREKLLKLLAEKSEESRQIMRKARDEGWSEIQEAARKSEIREDDKFKGKDELQKLVDEYSKKIDQAVERKKTEIEG